MELCHLLISALLVVSVSAACSDNSNCESCANDSQYWASCRWCPLTNACHSYYDWYNDCSSTHQVTEAEICSLVAEPSDLEYNPGFAADLVKWSSLAYIFPDEKDKSSIQSAISQHINPNYRIVEFIRNDCNLIFEYDDCGVMVALSETDKQIIVAFRGSTASTQLLEQALQLTQGLRPFSPTGGQVSSYNMNAHDSLYSCVKSLVEELREGDNKLKVTVTGHSLGGAQAQLAAVHLISDGVVSRDNLQVYTFGSPRVGDSDFAYIYDRIIGNSWRIVNRYDPVPQIVPTSILLIPFAYHTRREIYYDHTYISPNDSYTECRANEDSACSYGNSLCLTCIDEHAEYFIHDLGMYMYDRTSDIGTAAERTTRDQCESFIY